MSPRLTTMVHTPRYFLFPYVIQDKFSNSLYHEFLWYTPIITNIREFIPYVSYLL